MARHKRKKSRTKSKKRRRKLHGAALAAKRRRRRRARRRSRSWRSSASLRRRLKGAALAAHMRKRARIMGRHHVNLLGGRLGLPSRRKAKWTRRWRRKKYGDRAAARLARLRSRRITNPARLLPPSPYVASGLEIN